MGVVRVARSGGQKSRGDQERQKSIGPTGTWGVRTFRILKARIVEDLPQCCRLCDKLPFRFGIDLDVACLDAAILCLGAAICMHKARVLTLY